jgi:hypothetical protein
VQRRKRDSQRSESVTSTPKSLSASNDTGA